MRRRSATACLLWGGLAVTTVATIVFGLLPNLPPFQLLDAVGAAARALGPG